MIIALHGGTLLELQNVSEMRVPAAEPCLSPFESFLKAYEMVIALLHRYWPFMASIAESAASKLAKLIKA